MEFRDPSDFQPLLKGSEAFVEEDAIVIGPMSLNHDVSVGGTLTAYDHLDISGSLHGRGAVRAMGGLTGMVITIAYIITMWRIGL